MEHFNCSQVIFIYTALLTIQIVSKLLFNIKMTRLSTQFSVFEALLLCRIKEYRITKRRNSVVTRVTVYRWRCAAEALSPFWTDNCGKSLEDAREQVGETQAVCCYKLQQLSIINQSLY